LTVFVQFGSVKRGFFFNNVRLEQMANQLYIARPTMRVNGENLRIRRERRQYLLYSPPYVRPALKLPARSGATGLSAASFNS
jgi:hypothetical protein